MTREELAEKHSSSPESGYYWHEMFCPIARVLGVYRGFVVFQKLTGMGGKEMPKTWCVVDPNRYPLRDEK
jgi:hypothetical protein